MEVEVKVMTLDLMVPRALFQVLEAYPPFDVIWMDSLLYIFSHIWREHPIRRLPQCTPCGPTAKRWQALPAQVNQVHTEEVFSGRLYLNKNINRPISGFLYRHSLDSVVKKIQSPIGFNLRISIFSFDLIMFCEKVASCSFENYRREL